VKALCVITPPALSPQYFRECAEVIGATISNDAKARRRFAEIAEKYDLDEYGLPRRGTWYPPRAFADWHKVGGAWLA
jgi:hypothetical protein